MHLPPSWRLACSLLFLTACARPGPAPPTALTEWSLTVENHHWLDVDVYVAHGGQRTRVGVAGAASTRSFVLPAYLLGPGGDIELVATSGGRQRISSGLITLRGGQSVQWTLERELGQSSFAVH
jgi:hypothetical protein